MKTKAVPSLSDAEIKRRSLWGIAWVSFFWSVSSLMVFSVLVIYMKEELHISFKAIGRIDGIAVFLAFASKVFSGALSDYWRQRKSLIIVGAILTVVIKPLFVLATNVYWLFAARALDRLGKGIRSSPTDALVADLSPQNKTGRSFGLRQSIYVAGEVFGTALVAGLMMWTGHNYRLSFFLAVFPALLALWILIRVVKQPAYKEEEFRARPQWHIKHVRFLPTRYWALLSVVAILMLARFSESFVSLRAREVGFSVEMVVFMTGMMQLCHALAAFPMGLLADRFDRRHLLMIGFFILICANISFIGLPNMYGVFCGALLAGLHLGMTQGLIAASIAQATPADLRGTAFALYYLTIGTSVYFGNEIAGHLSEHYGLVAAFWGGGSFTTLACFALFLCNSQFKQQNHS